MQLMNFGLGIGSNGGNTPWITDIHNGILNPAFTYTGGQAIVPDANGILRRTPAGYPAVEGGRWAATVAEGALLVGLELVANGTFESGVTGWTPTGCTLASVAGGESGNCLQLTRVSGAIQTAACVINTVIGKTYEVDVFAKAGSSGNEPFYLQVTAAGLNVTIHPSATAAWVMHTLTFVATNTTATITIYKDSGTAGTMLFDTVSSNEIIKQWHPPTLGTIRSISTRKGIRQIQISDDFLGMKNEPVMVNKVTAKKSNPTDTAGVTGAGGAVPTRVDDMVALTAAGRHDICNTGFVYNLSIPQNGAISMAGAVANLNKHSVSLDMRLVSGTGVQLGLTGQTSDVTLTAAYSRQKKESLTPLNAADVITITNLNADTAVVRCILPGLEENVFCTSRIAPTADTAASQLRAASVNSAPTDKVFPSTGQDFAIFIEQVATSAGQTATLFSTRVDADNLFSISTTATAIGANLRKIATDNASSASYTHAADEKFQAIVIKSAMGISVKARAYSGGIWGAWSAWGDNETAGAKAASPIGATYQIGALEGIILLISHHQNEPHLLLKNCREEILIAWSMWAIT